MLVRNGAGSDERELSKERILRSCGIKASDCKLPIAPRASQIRLVQSSGKVRKKY